MADEADGASGATPDAAASRPKSRQDLLSKFAAADTGQAPAPPTSSAQEPEERASTSADEVEDEGYNPEAEAAADGGDVDDADAVEADGGDGDEQELKGHQAVKRAEVRMRRELAADRAQMQAEWNAAVAKVQPQLERLEKLEASIAKGRFDMDAAAELFGWSDDDMETIGHAAFARSPKYKDKPEVKAYSQRAQREREERAARDAIMKRQDALEAQIKQDRESAANAKAHTEWLGGVHKLVDDKSPLVKRLLAKNPEKANRLLSATALDLWEKTNKAPTDAAVIRELEKRRAAHAAEFVDPPQEAARGAGTAAPVTPAGKKPEAKKPTNGANGAPQKFKTRDELLEAFDARPLD